MGLQEVLILVVILLSLVNFILTGISLSRSNYIAKDKEKYSERHRR
jgi:hypothetical protein